MITESKIRSSAAQYQGDIVSPKVLELRKKIRDNDYVDSAIQRIAQVISSRLVENASQGTYRH